MNDQYITIKEVTLNNHCPECYSKDGLQLTFKQKFVESIFHKAISKETALNLNCNTCHTEIFPVRWTNDIEQVVEYQERAMIPKAPTFKLKQLTWILLITAIVIIVGLNVFLFMT